MPTINLASPMSYSPSQPCTSGDTCPKRTFFTRYVKLFFLVEMPEVLNYHLFQKFKLIGNNESNYLINTLITFFLTCELKLPLNKANT
jgi:hypothetical protein